MVPERLAGVPEPETLTAVLERAAASPRGVRFVAPDESHRFVPWSAIREAAGRRAAALRRRGVRPGDRVALVLPTGADFLEFLFGTTLAGALPVPLYPPVRLGRLGEYHAVTEAMLRGVRARLVVAGRGVRRLMGPSLRHAGPPLGCASPAELVASAAASLETPAPEDAALIQFSSGTTGAPRPILLTHRALLANARAVAGAILEAYPEEGELRHAGAGWLPLYHDMGLVGCVLTSLLHPADLTLIPPQAFVARPALWLRAIARWGATVSPAPSFAYALCAERVRDEELAGLDLSSWRVALCGAEPVAPEALRRFRRRFAPFGLRPEALTPVYGLAEAALAVTFTDPRRPFLTRSFDLGALAVEGRAVEDPAGIEIASVGRPLPGFALRVLDGEGAEVGPGRVGRVWIRGPSLMQGYDGLADDTASTLRDGWLDTGDLGFLHRGELFLHGRGKEMIVVRGRKYAPAIVEEALEGLDGMRKGRAAALGVVEDGGGERLVVLLERARGRQIDSERLAREVSRRVAARTGLVPASVEVLEPGALPRTSSGKIRRGEAARRWLAGTLRPPAPSGPLGVLRQLAVSSLRSLVATERG